MTIEQLFIGFSALGGVAAVIAAIINMGKQFGVVKDGEAPTWSLALNLIFFVAFVLLSSFWPDVNIAGLDATLQAGANFLVAFLVFVAQLGVSKASNAALRGTPVVGYSYSQHS